MMAVTATAPGDNLSGQLQQLQKRGSSNGQINQSQSSQPQAQATDQEKAAATKQAEKENSVCAMTPSTEVLQSAPRRAQ